MRWLWTFFLLNLAGSAGSVGEKSCPRPSPGTKAPEIIVEEWISERPAMKGKWILVDFWTTWCHPCVKSIPDLNRFHELFGDRMVVIGLSSQERTSVERMKEPVIDYYHGVDPQCRSKKKLGVKGIPHVVIIDPKGIIRWQGHPLLPGSKLTAEVIENLLATESR